MSELIITARGAEEARQKRFELEQAMAGRGLYPELTIGPVASARRADGRPADDDAEDWGVFYRRGDGHEQAADNRAQPHAQPQAR